MNNIKDPIFIGGMARTGTTLVSRILSRHKEIYILNETHLIREMGELLIGGVFAQKVDDAMLWQLTNQFLTIQKKGYYNKNAYEQYHTDATQIIEKYLSSDDRNISTFLKTLFVHEWNRNGKKWGGDQTPNHIFHIDNLIKLFPNAKFIHTIRDPRAVVLSQKNKWKAAKRKGQPKYEILRTRISNHPATQSLLWKKSIIAADLARKKYGKKKFHDIQFEDLSNDAQGVVKRLCHFLGITFEKDMLEVTLSMSSNIISHTEAKGINRDVVDIWRHKLSETEIFIVDLICSKEAEKQGFKKDNARPNVFSLLSLMMLFPAHALFTVALNLERIKNPANYIKKLQHIKK
jgi:hypothetical protein